MPLLSWIVLINFFSTDSFSGAETSRIIVPVLKFLFPWLNPDQLQVGHLLCRKLGHVTEYFVLGVLAWRRFSALLPSELMRARLVAGILVVAVAVVDEWHQAFVPSRTSSPMDVGLDVLGGILALVVIARQRHVRTLHSYPIL